MSRTWVVPPVGARLRGSAPPGQNGELAHVLAVVQTDDDGTKVVARRWFKHKRRWQYDVLDGSDFLVGLWRIEP